MSDYLQHGKTDGKRLGREAPGGDELASWMDAWQDPVPAGAAAATAAAGEERDQLERVKRSSRRFGIGLIALTVGELLSCAATLTFVGLWAAAKPDPWRWALLAFSCFLFVAAEAFVLINRRGTYRPKNQTLQAFVELEWLRAERQLRTIRFSVPFLLLEMGAIGGLQLGQLAADPERAARVPTVALHLLLITLALLAVLVPALWLWYRNVRRKMRELEPLRAAFAPA